MSARQSRHAKSGSQARTIAASFAGGVAAMAIAGLACTVAAGGGFGMSVAHASPVSHHAAAPAVEPIDVAAVQAQLAAANSDMHAAQSATDGAMNRLQALSAN